jgi:hypothetical protein
LPSKNKGLLFVISPIGKPDSSIRKRADLIFNYVISPVVSELGYDPVRADKISKPGIITTQIINHILNDPLVIADLTGHNPNVFYELAIRHLVRKPAILIIEEGENPPFDLSPSRIIYINHEDLESADKAKKELKKQIEAVEKDPSLVESPISTAVDLQALKQSSDPVSTALAKLANMTQEIYHIVKETESSVTPIMGSHKHTLSGTPIFISGEVIPTGSSDEEKAHKLACVPKLYAPGTTKPLISGPVETKVDITGITPFATPFGLVEVFWDNLGTKLAEGYADSTGEYEIKKVAIPEDVIGLHYVIVKDTLSSTIASTTFTITGEIKHIADP